MLSPRIAGIGDWGSETRRKRRMSRWMMSPGMCSSLRGAGLIGGRGRGVVKTNVMESVSVRSLARSRARQRPVHVPRSGPVQSAPRRNSRACIRSRNCNDSRAVRSPLSVPSCLNYFPSDLNTHSPNALLDALVPSCKAQFHGEENFVYGTRSRGHKDL